MQQLSNDMVGLVAGVATLLAFWQTDARQMRLWALAANCFFIVYGACGHHLPPLVLHAILLPLNLRMLYLLYRRPREAAGRGRAAGRDPRGGAPRR